MTLAPKQTDEELRHECVQSRNGAIKWLAAAIADNSVSESRMSAYIEHILCFQRTIEWIDNPTDKYGQPLYMKPIKPDEISVKKLPKKIVSVFNQLIKESYKDGRSEVYLSEAKKRLIESGMEESAIDLDVVTVYEQAGWEVSTLKYPDRLVFRRK